VLKLDPHPPRQPNGRHAYCRDTHVLSIHFSQFITLRDFTIDGSDSELPKEEPTCDGGRLNEHMFDVWVLNATNVTIDQMYLINAHGDGLHLRAERNRWPTMPFTENIAVTNTEFLANDRAGITFQRNVGKVSIVGNYFRNSGEDQDLDMEPSGDAGDRGPYDVVIENNEFERLQPKLTVTLGGGGRARATYASPITPSRAGVFSSIRPRTSPLPTTSSTARRAA
jgi:hypothetical protein